MDTTIHQRGSALILTVVLATLLAIVGVLFVLTARLDKMGSTATTQSRQLDLAVDTVITQLSDQLVRDVPGIAGQEYYDYPDVNNAWLSSLEPYEERGSYYWHQVSRLSDGYDSNDQDVPIQFVSDRASVFDSNGDLALADADGDGVGDALWFEFVDFSTSYGNRKPVYAAIRVIDHSAMLNINTAHKFIVESLQSASLRERLDAKASFDGSNVMQINLIPLINNSNDPNREVEDLAEALHMVRSDLDNDSYLRNVVWNFNIPGADHHPFDMSDEMELRNRYLLNHKDIKTRIEDNATLWGDIYNKGLEVPRDANMAQWFDRASSDSLDPNLYDRRHISTTWNMDRLIDPNGAPMVNVNSASLDRLFWALYDGIRFDPNDANSKRERTAIAAQMAVNIVDFRDSGLEPSDLSLQNLMDVNDLPEQGPLTFYGMELHPFISEVGFKIDPNDPENGSEFALELVNPSSDSIIFRNLSLDLYVSDSNQLIDTIELTEGVSLTERGEGRYIITSSTEILPENYPDFQINDDFRLAQYDEESGALMEHYDVYLVATVRINRGDVKLYLDVFSTDSTWFEQRLGIWQSASRDDTGWNVAYQDSILDPSGHSLGIENVVKPNVNRTPLNLVDPRGDLRVGSDETLPAELSNIGEIGRFLVIGPSTDPNATIGAQLTAASDASSLNQMFFDIANTDYAGVFRYLTVLDPRAYGHLPDETRVKGRININTAPWFVIQRLPWLDFISDPNQTGINIARAITLYRDDNSNNKQPGFESISELMSVFSLGILGRDSLSNQWTELFPEPSDDPNAIGPDMTPDMADDDLEERDLLFTRISNLITVRSDVFSAYILVRLGADGPQKRVLAILDRSGVNSPEDRVRVLALQPIPDAR